jgi:hypothetical protein
MDSAANDRTESDLEELLLAAWAEQLAQPWAQMNSSQPMARETSPETIGKEGEI